VQRQANKQAEKSVSRQENKPVSQPVQKPVNKKASKPAARQETPAGRSGAGVIEKKNAWKISDSNFNTSEKTPAKKNETSPSTHSERMVTPIRVKRDDSAGKPSRVAKDNSTAKEPVTDRTKASTRSPEKIDSTENAVTQTKMRAERTREVGPTQSPEKSSRIAAVSPSSAVESSRRTDGRLSENRRTPSAPHGTRSSRRSTSDQGSKIIVNGDNNVIVQGDVTRVRPRPVFVPRLYRSTVVVHSSPRWHNHGSFFSFTWSGSSCGRVAYLPYRNYYGFSYYYPSYHRKYVFVSIGGYWPHYYRYRRYYWYGCHPYFWYGSTVVPQEVNVYNTYNTYNTGSPESQAAQSNAFRYENFATDYRYPYGDTEADPSGLFDKKTVPVDAPEYESPADLCFANAVDLFANGSYEEAALQLRDAVVISPDDVILPFAYSQALFAQGDWAMAASVLRSAMAALPDDELTIYYPRGLYPKEEVLREQIAALEKAAAVEPFAADYQLLLGYQYIGLGELDKAAEPLSEAAKDPANELAAAQLTELAARLEEEAAKTE
jgi:tetratricopeptide (TPR) repeat protein